MARNKKLVAVLLGVTFILGVFCVSGAFAKTLKIKVAGISPLEYRGHQEHYGGKGACGDQNRGTH